MPIVEDVIEWFIALLFVAVIALLINLVFASKSKITRSVEAFWNTPAIVGFRKFFFGLFMLLFFGFFVVASAVYYVTESGWYPREREVKVFFSANHWIQGEIQTCYSDKTTTERAPDEEIESLVCYLETTESHVLRVKFWGPIKGDKPKVWKCERFPTSLTCRLQ